MISLSLKKHLKKQEMKIKNFIMIRLRFFLIFPVLFNYGIVFPQSASTLGDAIFGNMSARHIGPAVMSGRVSTIDVVKINKSIIYVGSASGGVWKSLSGGALFRPIFDDYCQSIGKITIDQHHPDTVWVGTGETWVRNSVSVGDGIYKTTDGGSSWQHMGLDKTERISDIIINKNDPDIVYAASMGHLWDSNEERGVYKTTDGGRTWEKIFYLDENTGCSDLDVDPSDPDILYAAMWSYRRYPWTFNSGFTGKSGFYKSTDGGKNWTKLNNGLPECKLGRIAIAVSPSNGNSIYLSVESEDQDKKGIYYSSDQGVNWKFVNSGFNAKVRPFYFSEIVADPSDPQCVYKCGLYLTMSEDGAESFRSAAVSAHSDIHCIWIDPSNTKHLLIGTDGGVYESFDKGYTCKMFMNLPLSQFYHVSVDNDKPFNVYGGLQDNGSWYGPSDKEGGITNCDWKLSYGGDGFYSFRHPINEDIVFSEYQGGNLLRYNKKTKIAKDIRPYPENTGKKYRFNWNTPVYISKNNPDRMYMGSQYLFMTEDMGDSWKIISPDLTTNDPEKQKQKESGGFSIDNSTAENHTTIYTICESPLNEKIIWAGTDDGNLQVTSNGGSTWNNVVVNMHGLPGHTWVTFVESGHKNSNTAYVTFDGHRTGDMKTYIYKTVDLGKTWTNLSKENIEGYALCVLEDPVNPDLLFLGTEFGLYVSLNGGDSWTRFKNNLPKVGIRDMVIHPANNYNSLVLATHGRGIIIIDDITPLRQLTPEVFNQPVYFFKTSPTLLVDQGEDGNWFTGDDNFIAPPKAKSAQIAYFMNKRHIIGKMYIEVYNQQGEKINEIAAGKSAGINIVEMPTRLRKPKSAPTNNSSALFGSIFGPNLQAGKYKVKLIKGKDVYYSEFELKWPEDSPYSNEDREEQRKLTMRLFNLSEHLAYVYNALDEMSIQTKNYPKEDKQLTKKLTEFVTSVNDFKKSLVSTEGDGYVNEDEKLREKISDLYRKVSQFPGRPSQSQANLTRTLENDMAEVDIKFNKIMDIDLTKINKILLKRGHKTITLISENDFLDKD